MKRTLIVVSLMFIIVAAVNVGSSRAQEPATADNNLPPAQNWAQGNR